MTSLSVPGMPVMDQNIILLTDEAVSSRSCVMKDNIQGLFRHMFKWQFWEECLKKEITDI